MKNLMSSFVTEKTTGLVFLMILLPLMFLFDSCTSRSEQRMKVESINKIMVPLPDTNLANQASDIALSHQLAEALIKAKKPSPYVLDDYSDYHRRSKQTNWIHLEFKEKKMFISATVVLNARWRREDDNHSYIEIAVSTFSRTVLDKPKKELVGTYKIDLVTGYLLEGNKASFIELRTFLLKQLSQ